MKYPENSVVMAVRLALGKYMIIEHWDPFMEVYLRPVATHCRTPR